MAYTNRDQFNKWLSGLLLLEFQLPELREGLRGPKDEESSAPGNLIYIA